MREAIISLAARVGLRPSRHAPFVTKLNKYELPERFARAAGPQLMQPIAVPAPATERSGGELESIWRQTAGGHKWLHYFKYYEQWLQTRRQEPIKLLEIGVYKGASLKMWSRYLPAGSVVVGIDIDPRTAAFDMPAQNVHVRVGDQSDAEFLGEVVKQHGPFDLIIDDGSHIASHMIASFRFLFLQGLRPGGIYIVEDTHTNYWSAPYRDQAYSFMDFAKDLVDIIHAPYFENASIEYFAKGSKRRKESIMVPAIGAAVEEVRFVDSIVAVSKKAIVELPVTEHL